MKQKYIIRNALYGVALMALMFMVYQFRTSKTETTSYSATNYYSLQGKTMGTTYSIKYLAAEGHNYQRAIDSLLEVFNQCLSTYIPSSEISRFNKADSSVKHEFEHPFFFYVLEKSKEIYELSGGAFDPTLTPIIRAWGFGNGKAPDKVPSDKVDSLLSYVGFDKYIDFNHQYIQKKKNGVGLNFNAIAQGYGVDVLALFLEQKGITNYMVEIGGEVRANGKGAGVNNPKANGWRIGIDKPLISDANTASRDDKRPLQAIVTLNNKSLVTSGNYRKFYVLDGKKYPHTIDSHTGYPVTHNLLSATALADDAITADALGTACMVLGKDKALEMINKIPNAEVFLIYDDQGMLKTTMTDGMRSVLEEVKE